MKIVINDELLCQEGELMIPARPDSEGDMRQGPSGPEFKQDDEGKDQDANKENQGENDHFEGKGEKVSEIDQGERLLRV